MAAYVLRSAMTSVVCSIKYTVKPFIISKMEPRKDVGPHFVRIRSWESCNGVKSNERSRQSCGSLEEQSKRADQAVLRSRPCRMDRMVCPLASSAIPSEGRRGSEG